MPRTLPADPVESARVAGLRYVTDDRPGIGRKGVGKGFAYVAPDGKKVSDPDTLARIRRLAIPPAWTQVWICPLPDGHLQATGRDARGRKQYRYHPDWMHARNETKYGRLARFGLALGEFRRRTDEDLKRPGLTREKVLATVAQLLGRTFIRVGNSEYYRSNRSVGLTTLRDHHVQVKGPTVKFTFKGKSGVPHDVEVTDPRLARIVGRCKDIPGWELFQYLDEDGQRQVVDSGDVNEYLRGIMGEDFTAKDFRTWAGTVRAAAILREIGPFTTARDARANVVEAVRRVAAELRNRPATCRKYYVHPAVLEAYLDGSLLPLLDRCRGRSARARRPDLECEEIAVLSILEKAARRPEPPDLEEALARSLEKLHAAPAGPSRRRASRRRAAASLSA